MFSPKDESYERRCPPRSLRHASAKEFLFCSLEAEGGAGTGGDRVVVAKAFAVVSVTPPFTVMDVINFPPSKPKQAHDSIMRAIAYGGEAA